MDRKDAAAGQPSTGSTGGAAAGNTADSSKTSSTTPDSGGFTDRARDIAGSTQDKLADVRSTVRDRAGTAKDSLADALQSGAEKLRNRMHATPPGPGGQLAGATTTATVTVDDGRVAAVGERVAGGMQATADWIRDADLDNLKSSIERQVREHPGRTLAIAVGIGYLLGKAFRNR